MDTNQLTAVLNPQTGMAWIPAARTILRKANPVKLLQAIVAIVGWSLVICLISFVFEVWRLENDWRVRIPRVAVHC